MMEKACIRCGYSPEHHGLGNFADGSLIGRQFLVCPTALYKTLAEAQQEREIDRAAKQVKDFTSELTCEKKGSRGGERDARPTLRALAEQFLMNLQGYAYVTYLDKSDVAKALAFADAVQSQGAARLRCNCASLPEPPNESCPLHGLDDQGCVSCGEAHDGGYQTEDVGSFCSQCWEHLREHFTVELKAENRHLRSTSREVEWQEKCAALQVNISDGAARLQDLEVQRDDLLHALKYLLELGGDDDRRICAEAAITKAEGR